MRTGVLALLAVAPLAGTTVPPALAAATTGSGPNDAPVLDLHGDVVVRALEGPSTPLAETAPMAMAAAPDGTTAAPDGTTAAPLPGAGGATGESLEGFLPDLFSRGFSGGRTLRLKAHASIETVRPAAQTVAAELSTITGAPFTVAAGTTAATAPAEGEVLVQISSSSPCGSGVAGCGQIETINGLGVRGTVWIDPTSLSLPSGTLTSLVRHEVAHTLGLGHYTPDFDGATQVMYPMLVGATPFGSGDRNGLALLAPGCAAVFPDAPSGHVFCDAISWTNRNGLLNGYPDGTFGTTRPVSRQALAALLHRYAGEPTPTIDPGFTDVPDSHPFADAIAWMVETGIANGYPDDTYRPGAPITRQAMAAFLHRYLLWRTGTDAGDHPQWASFADVPTGHPFEVPIETLGTYQVLQGTTTWSPSTGFVTSFKPSDPVSRQAAAAFLFRFDSL